MHYLLIYDLAEDYLERRGVLRLNNRTQGSVTIGGTVSPAGGNFEEPVTQATLKVVGAFHGLSRARGAAHWNGQPLVERGDRNWR